MIPYDDDETLIEGFRFLLTPEAISSSQERHKETEELLGELLTRASQDEPLDNRRYLRMDLLDRLLEESQARQLEDFEGAEDLATLAARLATQLVGIEPEATCALARAFCLGANARRLAGDSEGADALLQKAAAFTEFPSERALYSRIAGLIHWERGRIDEAEALLKHAAALYSVEGMEGEEGTSQALLGLVRSEDASFGNPMRALQRGWAEINRNLRPLLSLRLGLTLAACYAEEKKPDQARRVIKEAWGLYGDIVQPGQMVRVYWWEGRALSRLGERTEALQILESVRRKLLEEPSPTEAALVSVDVALLLAELDRAGEVEVLAADLTEAAKGEKAIRSAAVTLAAFGNRAIAGDRWLLGAARCAAAGILRTLRFGRLPMMPLPYA
jgi:tetratricopeptide (TPR) repeat protein